MNYTVIPFNTLQMGHLFYWRTRALLCQHLFSRMVTEPPDDVPARVKMRVRRLYDEGRFTQRQLASKLGLTYSAVHPYVSGERDISLEVLAAVCDLTKTPVAEMVVPETHAIKQLSPFESSFLRYVRTWPKTVQDALWSFLTYFADEEPVAAQSRNMHEMWRHATPKQRDNIFALAQLLREGMLGSDTRAGLIRQLLSEDGGRPSARAERRRSRERRKDVGAP